MFVLKLSGIQRILLDLRYFKETSAEEKQREKCGWLEQQRKSGTYNYNGQSDGRRNLCMHSIQFIPFQQTSGFAYI